MVVGGFKPLKQHDEVKINSKLGCAFRSFAKGFTFSGFNGKSLLKQRDLYHQITPQKAPASSMYCVHGRLVTHFLEQPFFVHRKKLFPVEICTGIASSGQVVKILILESLISPCHMPRCTDGELCMHHLFRSF